MHEQKLSKNQTLNIATGRSAPILLIDIQNYTVAEVSNICLCILECDEQIGSRLYYNVKKNDTVNCKINFVLQLISHSIYEIYITEPNSHNSFLYFGIPKNSP